MSYIRYSIDGNQVCAVTRRFRNLQESPAGFGDSLKEAFEDLMLRLEKRGELPQCRDLEDFEHEWLLGYKGMLD